MLAVAFNQATSRRKLIQVGKQPSFLPFVQKRYFLRLQSPLIPFSTVSRGKARPCRTGTTCQFPTLAFCLPPLNRRKFWDGVYSQVEKGNIMTPRSGFHTWAADGLPDITTLIKQIPRAKGYLAKREAIHQQYSKELSLFGVILATIRAQIAIDKANRIKSDFPLAGVWFKQIDTHQAEAVKCFQKHGFRLPESGFATWGDTFPSIDEILSQVTAQSCHNYLEIKQHIRTKYLQEWQLFSQRTGYTQQTAQQQALLYAQERADSINAVYTTLARQTSHYQSLHKEAS